MMLRVFCFIVILFVTVSANAQVAKIVPPQTPRQAVLEILTAKDNTAFERHLPEATRKFWASRLSSLPSIFTQSMLMSLAAGRSADSEGVSVSVINPKSNPNLETFQAGPVLIRDRDPQTQAVEELRIDEDDFNGDEATMELSLHQISAQGEPKLRCIFGRPVWERFRVRSLRRHLQLNQAAFAQLIGVCQQMVSRWETGRHAPTRATNQRLTLIAQESKFSFDLA